VVDEVQTHVFYDRTNKSENQIK